MFRMMVAFSVAVVSAVVGCRSSSTYLIEHKVDGMEVYHWTSRESTQDFTEGERELIFNRHLDVALKDFDRAKTPDEVKKAEERLISLSSVMKAARPERKMVQAMLSNYLDYNVVCRIYVTGSNLQHVSVLVPAGQTIAAPLREGVRYTVVFVRQMDYGREDVVFTHVFTQPAYDGIPAWVGYRG